MSYRENQHRVSLKTELPATARLGMFCEEKVLLMANYGAASTAYYASVSKLEQGMIRGSRETYAGQSVEIARIICEAALKELDDHVFTDGC
jgi:hypothetical protein